MFLEIYVIKFVLYDWLFKQIDVVVYYGGLGMIGVSLCVGILIIIWLFFGDQYFFVSRVEDLGVGVWVKKWGMNVFG